VSANQRYLPRNAPKNSVRSDGGDPFFVFIIAPSKAMSFEPSQGSANWLPETVANRKQLRLRLVALRNVLALQRSGQNLTWRNGVCISEVLCFIPLAIGPGG
jgi:hypothetical protein